MAIEKVGNGMLDNPGGLPLTTKGDLVVRDGSGADVRLPVGAAGKVLTSDPSPAEGVSWQDPPSSSSRIVGEIIFGAFAATPALCLPADGAAVSRATYDALFAALGTVFGAGDGSTTFNVPDLRGRVPLGAGTGLQRVAVSAVDATLNVLTTPSNDLQTGAAVVYTSTSSAAAPLVSGTTYYWVRLTPTTGKLATSRVNAVAGTTIDLTTAGSGTQALQVNLTARTVGEIGGEEAHTSTVPEMPAHTHQHGSGSGFSGGSGAGASVTVTDTFATGGSGAHANVQPFLGVGAFVYAGV
jgi:microcystin-dependent protein